MGQAVRIASMDEMVRAERPPIPNEPWETPNARAPKLVQGPTYQRTYPPSPPPTPPPPATLLLLSRRDSSQ